MSQESEGMLLTRREVLVVGASVLTLAAAPALSREAGRSEGPLAIEHGHHHRDPRRAHDPLRRSLRQTADTISRM